MIARLPLGRCWTLAIAVGSMCLTTAARSQSADTIELRLAVAPMELDISPVPTSSPLGKMVVNLPSPEPLFHMRAPVTGVAEKVSNVASRSENEPPRYPQLAISRRVEGTVLAQFVVDADGKPDLASIQILQATAREFAAAVLEAFPRYRFAPLEVSGCRLATVVRMPFVFALEHD